MFSAEKEWDRPRIIIDNRCTMPSRVRAFLYGENRNLLIKEMADSLGSLMDAGCTHIMLACNTSHLFLDEVYILNPRLKKCMINMIDLCCKQISKDNVNEVFLIASEGTITSEIYQNTLKEYGVKCFTPSEDEFALIRRCIEAVKTNSFHHEIEEIFVDIAGRMPCCILGCTELPILYEKYGTKIKADKVYDPGLIAMEYLREIA